MSSFYTNLSDRFHSNADESELDSSINEHFNQIETPFDDFFVNLSSLIENDPNHRLKNFLRFLVAAFRRWKDESKAPVHFQTDVDLLILRDLPMHSMKDFLEICQIPKERLLKLLRSSLRSSTSSTLYKRALNILVQMNFQMEFTDREILLPLILNSKDHLIEVYLNETPAYQEYLLNILNRLYVNGGKNIDEILKTQFGMTETKFSKRTLAKLAVRYWNLYGNEQNETYPNLATLQARRTLGYLISLKYKNGSDEKAMSDECWNELVEDLCRGQTELGEYLLEVLADKDDLEAVRYWSKTRRNAFPLRTSFSLFSDATAFHSGSIAELGKSIGVVRLSSPSVGFFRSKNI